MVNSLVYTPLLFSAQHTEDAELAQIKEDLRTKVAEAVLPQSLSTKIQSITNPTGRFVTGGPVGDCGLTGRKTADTYVTRSTRWWCVQWKDPSKVDRSAAYLGRYAAKNIVAAGFATRCLVQLAYAIGVADPVSVMVDTYGTGTVSDEALADCVRQVFPCRRRSNKRAQSSSPNIPSNSAYGHFDEKVEIHLENDKVDAVEFSA